MTKSQTKSKSGNSKPKSRIAAKFAELKAKKKCAFIGYICAGDPDLETSFAALKSMPASGVDIIEIGVPFLDPSGDGPIIENAAKRAIAAGTTLHKTLEMVAEFRHLEDSRNSLETSETPVILMSYFNPILKFGIADFFAKAKQSGVDGVLIVDLPLEEESEVAAEIAKSGLDFIHLIAPSTNFDRALKIAKKASGFLYLISLMGITGTKQADVSTNRQNLSFLQKNSNLPVVIGFGIQNPDQARDFSKIGADGVVIGSSLVLEFSKDLPAKKMLQNFVKKLGDFASAIHGER